MNGYHKQRYVVEAIILLCSLKFRTYLVVIWRNKQLPKLRNQNVLFQQVNIDAEAAWAAHAAEEYLGRGCADHNTQDTHEAVAATRHE